MINKITKIVTHKKEIITLNEISIEGLFTNQNYILQDPKSIKEVQMREQVCNIQNWNTNEDYEEFKISMKRELEYKNSQGIKKNGSNTSRRHQP